MRIEPTALVAFENTHPTPSAHKTEAIRLTFDVSATVYYQSLLHHMASPEMLRLDPVLVHRLNRVRRRHEERRAAAVRSRTIGCRSRRLAAMS